MLVTTGQAKFPSGAYRFLLPFMHSEFTSDKGLLTIAKKILKSILNVREELPWAELFKAGLR